MEKDNDLEQNNINKLSLERKNKLKGYYFLWS